MFDEMSHFLAECALPTLGVITTKSTELFQTALNQLNSKTLISAKEQGLRTNLAPPPLNSLFQVLLCLSLLHLLPPSF